MGITRTNKTLTHYKFSLLIDAIALTVCKKVMRDTYLQINKRRTTVLYLKGGYVAYCHYSYFTRCQCIVTAHFNNFTYFFLFSLYYLA